MDVRDFTLLLGSQDLPRLERFYGETLGLERLPSQHHVVFRLPGGKLRLIEHSEVAEHAREPERLRINLFIDDVRSEAARLEPLGVKLVRPLSQMAWGGWLVTLEDPDGNYVQLIEGS
ncbi:MAG: VOC family protein [Chloroflexi bacterium]|nr:VOC family protein [Chloroflexota bacterium]